MIQNGQRSQKGVGKKANKKSSSIKNKYLLIIWRRNIFVKAVIWA